MSIVKEYLALTTKWKKEYGNKTLVLLQVGSFFEVYALLSPENEMIGSNIAEFASLNEMVISPKNVFVDGMQVVMAGFGLPQIDKYVKKLQEHGYTILVYKQDIQGKNTTRSLCEIISPGTFFSTSEEDDQLHISNNIMCIWIHASVASKYFTTKMTKKKMTIGIANIDIYTGKTTMSQFDLDYTFHNPNTYDELERYIAIYRPSECILLANIEDQLLTDILSFVGLESRKIHRVNLLLTDTEKNKTNMQNCAANAEKQIYQTEILKRFYPQLNRETLAASLMTYFIAAQSLCFLLDFVHQHSPNLVNKLHEPVFENHTDKLVLANHSLKQLNIIDDAQHTGKLRSVSALLNNCATSMGKRQFIYSLHHPTTNTAILQKSYAITAHLLKKTVVDWETQLRHKLSGIKDMEKLTRKLVLNKITPKDFALLVHDLQMVAGIYAATSKDEILTEYIASANAANSSTSANISTLCNEMIEELERVFELEKCAQIHSTEFGISDEAFFIRKGVNATLDALLKANMDSREKMEAIRLYLSNLVKGIEKPSTASAGAQFIKIHETPKSLPVLLGTSKRVASLKSQLKKTILQTPSVKITYKSNYTQQDETFDFNIALLSYDTNGSNKKDLIITSDEITKLAKDMQTAKDKLLQEMLLFYKSYVVAFLQYEMHLEQVMQYTTVIDILQNKCYIAYKYNYCQPQLDTASSEKKAYFSFKNIRHPLIEHLQTNELYVTNDLDMGSNGLLLYGTNAVGKTSFIKSVGIALIMAQAGLFVPCEAFIYKPYTCIFTRILGNDNIFKGLSTFAVEMSELRTILTQADAHSLVLGDELCSGTESDSALSIFTAGLETLHQKESTFLFATHFHEIVKYQEVQALTRLQMMHMAVQYNAETGILMYDRKLRAGPGESMYGLEVCKSLNLPDEFLERAHAIRMRYKPESRNILSLETSQYNAKKIVGGLCEMCSPDKKNKASEVHHLQPQKKAKKEKNDYISTFHKNHPANLVNICEECHQKIHLIGNKEHRIVKTGTGEYTMVVL
jgi:DNA mismatch repair protein MutS